MISLSLIALGLSLFLLSGCGSSALQTTLFAVAGLSLASASLIMVARTTMVAWITVLVLLTCLGKRRRVLAHEGKKITADIAVNVIKIMIKERGFFAVICAATVSFIAMAQGMRV